MTAEQQLFDDRDSLEGAGLELLRAFEQQKQAFKTHSYPGFEQRRQHLQALYQLVAQHQDEIATAISRDFSNRSADETRLFEVMTSLNGIKHSLKHLRKWMKPSKREVGILFQPASAYVMYQPLGVVGIIVPWNYPLFLAVGP
ncbi:aldehyde dehydrogenase family protein, partial [Acinetobacter sp.]